MPFWKFCWPSAMNPIKESTREDLNPRHLIMRSTNVQKAVVHDSRLRSVSYAASAFLRTSSSVAARRQSTKASRKKSRSSVTFYHNRLAMILLNSSNLICTCYEIQFEFDTMFWLALCKTIFFIIKEVCISLHTDFIHSNFRLSTFLTVPQSTTFLWSFVSKAYCLSWQYGWACARGCRRRSSCRSGRNWQTKQNIWERLLCLPNKNVKPQTDCSSDMNLN